MFQKISYTVSTIIFTLAVLHSFFVDKIEYLSHHSNKNSIARKFFHLMAEVELVFIFWSGVLIFFLMLTEGRELTVNHLKSLNLKDAFFVFIIMLFASSRPVILMAEKNILRLAKRLPFNQKFSLYFICLIIGPILGSLITEPAAMAVSASILLEFIYSDPKSSSAFKYATLSLLFVNISIGGSLTHFAAPAVVVVAEKWGWGSQKMFLNFGYKSIMAILCSTIIYGYYFKNEFKNKIMFNFNNEKISNYINFFSLLVIVLSVIFAQHVWVLLGLLILFLIVNFTYKKSNLEIKFKASLFVGLFLVGLIYLGSFQYYWINFLLLKLSDFTLNIGAIILTSISDNALITYLGSLTNISESAKYYLLSGALTGGGLTIIANAPNPIGIEILKSNFGVDGIKPLQLFIWAIIPTFVAFICFYFLPNLN
jgi:hypothetical protein